jgi:hypothetical protein
MELRCTKETEHVKENRTLSHNNPRFFEFELHCVCEAALETGGKMD